MNAVRVADVAQGGGIRRPVWLFSLDSEQFHAAPTATGGLIAWYRAWGAAPEAIDFRQIHFRDRADVGRWIAEQLQAFAAAARAALAGGLEPVVGIGFYTWNAAEFLELVRALHAAAPEVAIVGGGPHVQQAEDYLGIDPIDVIVLGEGEATFQELLDAPRAGWARVPGIAWLGADGSVRRTPPRERQQDLARIPSPFDVIELVGADGQALYDAVTYETTRGCPYRCAFCEWGTGAIGTKMLGFPLERLRRDWERIVRAGIPNIWLADSNFGALRDDLEKTRLICELKQRYGLPRTFATSWSKKHSPRVQEIVLLLHRHGLLPFYQLALQTLTPRALELCHRQNMAANEYEPIAQRMAEAGIPVSAELIWGLPGDDLASFERNLDLLLGKFPHINIFGYTLLPGTEFHARRAEYRIETLPVAGYGKARGEYVVGCHTFDRAEGEEGYFLIAAHALLLSGQVIACTARELALGGEVPVGRLLRVVLDALLLAFRDALPGLDPADRMQVYEQRASIYVALLADHARAHAVVRETVLGFIAPRLDVRECECVARLLALDAALCPRHGEAREFERCFDFDAGRVLEALGALRRAPPAAFDGAVRCLRFASPGGLGVVLNTPDGGAWLRSRLLDASPAAADAALLVFNEATG